MANLLDEGDWRIATLGVVDDQGDPGDGTTGAVLTVIAPDGTTTTPAVSSPDGGPTWESAPYELTSPGEWVERWAVTGRGAGKARNVVLVAPDPTSAPSGGRVYATTADYARWLGTAPPSGSRRALAAASGEVEQMTRLAIYDVDDDQLPTDTAVAAALRDATCAQAEYAQTSGDANLVGAGTPSGITQVGLGSLSYAKTASPGIGGAAGNTRWSTSAWQILQRAGLTGGAPGEPAWNW